jgi:hypothetical protein
MSLFSNSRINVTELTVQELKCHLIGRYHAESFMIKDMTPQEMSEYLLRLDPGHYYKGPQPIGITARRRANRDQNHQSDPDRDVDKYEEKYLKLPLKYRKQSIQDKRGQRVNKYVNDRKHRRSTAIEHRRNNKLEMPSYISTYKSTPIILSVNNIPKEWTYEPVKLSDVSEDKTKVLIKWTNILASLDVANYLFVNYICTAIEEQETGLYVVKFKSTWEPISCLKRDFLKGYLPYEFIDLF